MRVSITAATIALFVCCATARAQTPGILYTWAGTGNVHDWVAGSSGNAVQISNSTPGQLTVVELGDSLEPFDPGLAHVIRDGFNRRLESSLEQGGLDLWGLEAIEIDLAHNGSGNVNVQFFVQATPAFNYVWAGSDGTLNGPDYSLPPGMHTLRFPLSLLTPAQQAYIRAFGLSVRDHESVGNVTWDIFEVRSTGTPPPVRDLATHDVGTSDNGLNGAYINFEADAVVGNNGAGQGQVGLSHNPTGPGSLQWTDRGNGGNPDSPSGAAISWVNGTIFDGNTFNERLADFSNYDTVTFRISATDPLNGGGELGVQAFFQTGNYVFQTTSGGAVGEFGEINLPIDGQYHDLVFPLGAVSNRQNVQAFGINLFSHANDLIMNVDLVRFEMIDALECDYNSDGSVDAADYVLWRKNDGSTNGYNTWRTNFGRSGGSIAAGGASAVPEPTALVLMLTSVVAALQSRTRRYWKSPRAWGKPLA
jgi:hypothetical protein